MWLYLLDIAAETEGVLGDTLDPGSNAVLHKEFHQARR
jgi:hypothetical protein